MSEQRDGTIPEFTITDRLRRAREWAGLDQDELAERIGMARTTIGNYERGITPAKRPILVSWAIATGVSFKWLQTGHNDDDSPLDGPITRQYSDNDLVAA